MNKQVRIALRSVYGIGSFRANDICAKCNIAQFKRVSELQESEIVAIRAEAEKYVLGEDLKTKIVSDISRLIAIGCRRGLRRQKGLPVRGQGSKTNAKTSRRVRGFVGAAANANASKSGGNASKTKNKKK